VLLNQSLDFVHWHFLAKFLKCELHLLCSDPVVALQIENREDTAQFSVIEERVSVDCGGKELRIID